VTTTGEEPGSHRHAPGARWDLSEVSVRLVVVMLVLTAVIAVLGWQYRPGTGAYPTVPRRLALTVDADAQSLVLTLVRTGSDGAILTLYDDDRFGDSAGAGAAAHGVTPGGWGVGIDGLGTGRVVRDPGPGRVPIPPDQSAFDHTPMRRPTVHRAAPVRLTDVGHVPAVRFVPDADGAPLYLQIRWGSHAPVRLDGAYLGAQLPGVQVHWSGGAPASVPMTTTLVPHAGDVGQFSIQATSGPSVTGARTWTWHVDATPSVSGAGEPPSGRFDPVAFSGVNVAATQDENVRAFLAGVLLGIAGGAVMTAIVELAKIRRVRKVAGAETSPSSA
jgi:hypothetical protein